MKNIWHGVFIMATLAIAAGQTDARPHDHAAVETLVESVGNFADRRDFEALEKLYDSEVSVDYRSLAGGEVELKSPQALLTQWASVLPGFDVTRHRISNIQVTVDGLQAIATADVVADHYLGDRFWQVQGDYQYKLIKEEDVWQITHHTFNLRQENGDRDTLVAASEKATVHLVPYLQRQQTKQTVRDFLISLETKDMEQFSGVWADDAVQEMPYAPQNFPTRITGKQNIVKHYAQWPTISGKADFTSNLTFYPMRDPTLIFAEWTGKVDIIPTGRQYNQVYGGLFHVENGKITLFREYFDPIPFVYAFGLNESETVNPLH